ncbi:MAG: prenyltransferase [Halobacteriales archaeon]
MVRSWLTEWPPRIWALWAASRPSQLALIVLVYLLGAGMASAGPPLTTDTPAIAPGRLLAGALAVLPVAVTVHYANEYADAGTDALAERTPFSGGSGALVATGLPASFLGWAALGAGALSVVALGGLLVLGTFPLPAVVLLTVVLLAGLAYSLPPVELVRRGLGEAVNAALGGVVLPVYGIAVLATPAPAGALATLPFALVVGCNLLATHWPDRDADAAVGKRTLAVRWSPRRLRRAYLGLAAVAAAVTAGLWLAGVFTDAVALAHLVPVPFLAWGRATLTRRRDPLPSVLAMVALALAATAAWWWVALA